MPNFTSAPVRHQRMALGYAEGGGPIINPGDPPVVAIFAASEFVEEGAVAGFTLNRVGGLLAAPVTINVIWSSELGNSDFAGNVNQTYELPANQISLSVNIQTAVRSGVQNTRTITCRLVSVSAGFISPINSIASMQLIDLVDTITPWWRQLPYRSGRAWAGGVCANYVTYDTYEDTVAYIDGFNAANFGESKTRCQTWQRVAGGPLNNPNVVDSSSQFNWGNSATQGSQWERLINNRSLANKAWVCWVHELMPVDMNNDESNTQDPSTRPSNFPPGNRNRAFDYINGGNADQWYRDLGARLRIQLEARGWDLRWFVGRPYHEMQQTNFYRVYPDTKTKFVNAFNRAVDKIREGAQFNLRYVFAPSPDRIYDGGNFGALSSFLPSHADAISMSHHPARWASSRSGYFNGSIITSSTNNRYGLENDVWNLSDQRGWPLAFGEWSPKYEPGRGCPIADDVYQWFYQEYLWPHRRNIVFDLIFGRAVFDKNAYRDTNNGSAAWSRGVDKFAQLWKGKGPRWPNYTPPL